MKFDVEMKLVGEAYTPNFANGLTMGNGPAMEKFKRVYEDETGLRYESEDGLVLELSKKEENGAITLFTSVENKSKDDVTLEMMSSFVLRDFHATKIHRMQSFWSAEGKLKTESVTDLHLEHSWSGCGFRVEKFGSVGSFPVRKWFPFIVAENEETGEFFGAQLYLASSWQMEIRSKEKNEGLTFEGGIADRDFGHWTKTLKVGERFEAPKAVVAFGNSLYDVCDKLVKAQKPAISVNDRSMGILFNEYCTTWGNPTEENLMRICDRIAGKGIDFLVMDSGWYGDAENWWDMIGDWEINRKRFPHGLKPVADYISQHGMIPGMWFEMESVTAGNRKHWDNEHLVKRDGVSLTVGGRRYWDMEDPEAVKYLTDSVIGRLKDDGFGYVKIDYNDAMGVGCDGAEGPGENLRKKILASQAFFKKMADEIPGLVIENCSSGGHRLEPSMMELVSQASFSDAHETTAIPLIAANLHRVIKPSQSQIWCVLRAGDDSDRLHYSLINTMLGRMCLSGDIYDLSDEQWGIVDEGMAFYRAAADIIKDGKTTLIDAKAESYNRPLGSQLVIRESDDRKLFIFHRFEESESLETVLEKNRINPVTLEVERSFGKADKDFSAVAMIIRK